MRKTLWKSRNQGSPPVANAGLPEARKALAERYTIDADEAELLAERVVDAQAAREREEERRRVAEAQARREAEERARLVAVEQARRDAEEQPRREVEEQARRQAAEEQARREAEEQAQRVAEEQPRNAAEEQAQREAEAAARREADEQARREAEERARREEQATDEAATEVALHRADAPRQAPADGEPFPIYVWLQRSGPEPTTSHDWPRSLMRTKEEHGQGASPPT